MISPSSAKSSTTWWAKRGIIGRYPSSENHRAGIRSHVEPAVRRRLLEHDRHRYAPLQADPIGGRRDVGQQHGRLRIAAEAARDAGDLGAAEMPGRAVEPHPGGAADLERADIVLLVVGDDAPAV